MDIKITHKINEAITRLDKISNIKWTIYPPSLVMDTQEYGESTLLFRITSDNQTLEHEENPLDDIIISHDIESSIFEEGDFIVSVFDDDCVSINVYVPSAMKQPKRDKLYQKIVQHFNYPIATTVSGETQNSSDDEFDIITLIKNEEIRRAKGDIDVFFISNKQ